MAGDSANGVSNGVPKGAVALAPRRAFPLRLFSSSVPGRLELGLALIVIGTIFGVAYLIFTFPGPLVVSVRDDAGGMVMGARVTCSFERPGGGAQATRAREFSGITDVFGEAKWPGLEKGTWFCRAVPPDRFQGAEQDGEAVVRARSPATVHLRFDRPVHVNLTLKRPAGASRARMAVRGLCPATQTAAEASWEVRTSVLSGNSVLWLPFGRECRIGLVAPSLPRDQAGLVEHPALDCESLPCTPRFTAASGASIDLELAPTLAQWQAVRPAPEPEADGGT